MTNRFLKSRWFLMIPVFVCFSNTIKAQTALTIEDCLQRAADNYPLIQQYDLIERSREYSTGNILKNYLPQVSLNAQASLQSDVTGLPLDMSSLPFDIDIPTLSKDQYRATIDVSQQIWDGGITNTQRKLIEKNSEAEKQTVEVSLYAIREKIIQLYFGILAIDKHLTLLELIEENLTSSKNIAQSMIKNGTAMQGDIDLIYVELLSVGKNKIEQESLRKAYLRMLGLFVNQSLSDDVLLQIPITDYEPSREINRPELNLFNAQNSIFDMQRKLINAQNMPKIALFAQGGYGRPGLDLLDDGFRFFAIGGIKLTWNINRFYTQKNDLRLIEQKRQSTQIQKETFLFNTNLTLTKEEEDIRKLKELIIKEDEIVQFRTRIKTVSESKYRNGVYQINELIRDVNAENQAMQSKSLHEIHYLMKIYNYNHLQGNK
ncbi:MAG: TolC family protein [Tannerella sp.]|nr:TolC family protein [Tannerella sp.]